MNLPTAEARRKAARELARRDDVDVEQWLQLARRFGDFEDLQAGHHTERVALTVGEAEELTELHYFVPSSYQRESALPLIVALHGAGGNGRHEVSAFQEFAEEHGYLILAPTDAGPNVGYSFAPREQLAVLAALRWMRLKCNVDENRIHLTGVSRGGHLCFDMARHPSWWASVTPRIGGPSLAITGGRNNIRLAFNFSHLPLVILQGMGDQAKMLVNQNLALERLTKVGGQARRVEFAEHGHSYDHEAFDWAVHFSGAERDPQASKLLLASARKGEGELLWISIARLDRDVKEDFQPRVDPNKWNAWGYEGQARFVQDEADQRTALVRAEFLGEGRFAIEAQLAARVRLLLPSAMLGENGAVEVDWKGRSRKKKLKGSSEILLEHFVEHFDRRFLPVAEWELR